LFSQAGKAKANSAQIQVARNRKGPGRFARRAGSIIRPLIEIKRPEIENYLKSKKLASVTDSSNLKTDYLRNKIRLELMPLLEGQQPQLAHLLAQTAEILRDEDAYLDRITEAWFNRNVEQSPHHAFKIPIAAFLSLPVVLRGLALGDPRGGAGLLP